MLLAEIDAVLARFSAAVDTMTTNLLDLEANPTNKLLDPATLRGSTQQRVAAARQALASLWEHFSEFKSVVERAKSLRGVSSHVPQNRIDDLDRLLRGPSISLPPLDVPLANRGLTTPGQTLVATTPEELLTNMAAAFDAAKHEILGVDECWRTLVPRLTAAQQLLGELEALATSLGEHDAVLDRTRARLDRMGEQVANDPLAVNADEFAQMEASLSTVRAQLDGLAHDRDALDADLQECTTTIDEIAAALGDGEAALAEAQVKIANPNGLLDPLDRTCLTDPQRGLTPWLERLNDLARSGDWRHACRGLDQWQRVATETLASARTVAAANAAPVEARNELRGRLDALTAKADRLGMTEDPEASALRQQAHDVLYTAPTDLDLGSQLVARYGASLTATAR
jgi:hypothetical protein